MSPTGPGAPRAPVEPRGRGEVVAERLTAPGSPFDPTNTRGRKKLKVRE